MNIPDRSVLGLGRVVHLLRYSFALFFIISGVDKFFLFFIKWSNYISPLISNLVPENLVYLLYGWGAVEILIGLYILFICARSGGFIATIYFILLAINFFSLNILNHLAITQLLLAISAYSMASIEGIRRTLD